MAQEKSSSTTTKNAGIEFHNLFGGLFRNTIKSFRNTPVFVSSEIYAKDIKQHTFICKDVYIAELYYKLENCKQNKCPIFNVQ